MSFIASTVVKLLDPIGFVIVLLVSLVSRQRWIIPVAAVSGALIAETLLTVTQYTRSWGQGIATGVVASTLQALACFVVLGLFRKTSKSVNANPDTKQ